MRRIALTSLLLFLISGSASAQFATYSNENEVLGAAAISPLSTYQILQKLIARCSEVSASLRSNGNAQLGGWEKRHHAFLLENQRIQAQLERSYTEPDAKKTFRDMLDRQVPAAVQKQYEAFVSPIDTALQKSQQEQLCQVYVNAIQGGKFDLKNTDPVVSKFLEKRIQSDGR
ncbi:hypothetical protein [Herbaspirillum camelliae]|uniref:hypothetical protein n=1 Tax=Herbaspirillum camelliae TaxID=1892903 RepID=UPI000B0324A8|nr:hypothetical protein [Herbaspirillum camelliae]